MAAGARVLNSSAIPSLEDDTTNGVPGSNSRANKRGACDRCRGQKLRCLREDHDPPEARCIRCSKAGATCCYSVPKRAGRHPGSGTPSSQQWKENGNGIRRPSGAVGQRHISNADNRGSRQDRKAGRRQDWIETRSQRDCLALEEHIAGAESEEEDAEDKTLINASSSSSLQETSSNLAEAALDFSTFPASTSAPLPWPDEPLLPFYSNDVGEALRLESFIPKYSWDLHNYQSHLMDDEMLADLPNSIDEQCGDAGPDTPRIPGRTSMADARASGSSDEAMDLDLMGAAAHVVIIDPEKASNAQDSQTGIGEGKADANAGFGTRWTNKAAFFKDSAEKEELGQEASSVNRIQHLRMKELSELSMDLYAQLTANDPETYLEPAASHATPTTAFHGQLVGSVLKSSDTFLRLLKSFSTLAIPSSTSSPTATHFTLSKSPTDSIHNSHCSSALSSPTSNTMDSQAYQPSPHHELPCSGSSYSHDTSTIPPLPPSTDITIVLQLLTCYIRIVHLHSVMYARILEYITTTRPLTASVPPVFPGMLVGGVSLDRFGAFQIKLLLQISVHVLGEIETALGLPEGYRVGNRRKGGRGFLEASLSAGFVEHLMKDGGCREERKRVEFVKEQLVELRRVLKGAIDF